VGGDWRQPDWLAQPSGGTVCIAGDRSTNRQWLELLLAMDQVHLKAGRIGEPNPLAATWLRVVLYKRAELGGGTVEIGRAESAQAEAGPPRTIRLGDVHMVRRAPAAHVQGVPGAGGGEQPEGQQKRLHLVQILGLVAYEGDVLDGDHAMSLEWIMGSD
jgi:hypothetical protein